MSYQSVILDESSLVSLWQLNELTGSTVIDSKENNNGTYNGGITLNQIMTPIWIAGASNQRNTYFNLSDYAYNIKELSPTILLNGSSGYIQVANSASLNLHSLTLEAWVNLNQDATGFFYPALSGIQVIFFKGTVGGNGFGLRINQGFLEVYVGNNIWLSSSSNQINALSAIQHPKTIIGGWNYVVATISSNGIVNIYLNNILIYSMTSPIAISNTDPLYIGQFNSTNYLNGFLTNIAIYNDILSFGQITKHWLTANVLEYADLILSNSKLISYYRLDEGLNKAQGYAYTGTTAIDFKGNNNGIYEPTPILNDTGSGPFYSCIRIPSINISGDLTVELQFDLPLFDSNIENSFSKLCPFFLYKLAEGGQPGWGFYYTVSDDTGALDFYFGSKFYSTGFHAKVKYFAFTVTSTGILTVYINSLPVIIFDYQTNTLNSEVIVTNFHNDADLIVGAPVNNQIARVNGNWINYNLPLLNISASHLAIYNDTLDRNTILEHYVYLLGRNLGQSLQPYYSLILSNPNLLSYWPMSYYNTDIQTVGTFASISGPTTVYNSLSADFNYNVNALFNNLIYEFDTLTNVIFYTQPAYINSNSSIDHFGNVTFECWMLTDIFFNSNSTSDKSYIFFGKFVGNNQDTAGVNSVTINNLTAINKGFAFAIINHTFQFWTGIQWFDSGHLIDDFNYHHIVVTLDVSGNIQIYIDGFFRKSGLVSFNLNSTPNTVQTTADLTIVYKNNSNTIDTYGVAIYSSIMPADVILDHYITGTIGGGQLNPNGQDLTVNGAFIVLVTDYVKMIMAEPAIVSYWPFYWASNINYSDRVDNNYLTWTGPEVTVNNWSGLYVSGIYPYLGFFWKTRDANNLQLTNFSLEAWFETTSINQQVIFSKYNHILPCNGFALCINNGFIGIYTGGSASSGTVTETNVARGNFVTGAITIIPSISFTRNIVNYTYTTGTQYNDGNGHYVVATISDTGVVKIYVDSILIYTHTFTLALTNTAPLYVGAESISIDTSVGIHSFIGIINDAAIYNTVLTPTQITNHYLGTRTLPVPKVYSIGQVDPLVFNEKLFYGTGDNKVYLSDELVFNESVNTVKKHISSALFDPSYNATILNESSLVSYWQLNELIGNTAIDSKSSNNGIYNGNYTLNQILTSNWVKGTPTGNNTYSVIPTNFGLDIRSLSPSVLFNGVDSYIHVSDASNLHLINLSMETWFNLSSNLIFDAQGPEGNDDPQILYNPTQVIFSKYSVNGSGWGLGINNGFIEVYVGEKVWQVTSIDQINLRGVFPQRIYGPSWHHIVVTISSSGIINIYVDTVLIWTKTVIVNLSNTDVLYIGKSANNNNYFNGYLMHCAIYNAVLTQTQVTTHYLTALVNVYNNLILSETSLISYWRFAEGLNVKNSGDYYSGTTVIDSRNSNNGIYELPIRFEPNQPGPQYSYINIPDTGELHSFSAITIEMHFSFSFFTDDFFIFFSKYSGSDSIPGSGFAFGAQFGGTGYYLAFWTGTEWFNCSDVSGGAAVKYNMVNNEYQSNTDIALTLANDGTINIYANGVFVKSGTVTFNLNCNNSLIIGANQSASIIVPTTIIKDLAIYNAALSHNDIIKHRVSRELIDNQNYNYPSLILNETSLLAYWQLIDSSGILTGSSSAVPNFAKSTLTAVDAQIAFDCNYNSNANYNNGIYTAVDNANLNGAPSDPLGIDNFYSISPALILKDGDGAVIVPAPTNFDSLTDITLEVWCYVGNPINPINPTSPPTKNTYQHSISEVAIPLNYSLMLKSDGTTGWALAIIDNTFQFFYGNGWLDSQKFVNDGQIHHYAVTISSSVNVNMYVDGFLVKTGIVSPNYTSTGLTLNIGPWSPVIDNNIFGLTRNCAIYNTALSASDILNHYIYGSIGTLNFGAYTYIWTPYALQIINESNLISYWQFNTQDDNTSNLTGNLGRILDRKDNNNGNLYTYALGSDSSIGTTTLGPSFYFGSNFQGSSILVYQASTCFITNSPGIYDKTVHGISNFVLTSIDNNSNLNALIDVTLEAWFRTNSVNQSTIFSKYDINLPCDGFALCINNGKIGIYAGGNATFSNYTINNVGSNYIIDTFTNTITINAVAPVIFPLNTPNYIYSTQIYNDNIFHHIVATISSLGVINIYVDGILILNTTVVQHILNNSLLFIGCDSNTYFEAPAPVPPATVSILPAGAQLPFGINSFEGYLMHCSIYNDILTQTQVNEHYNLGKGITYQYNRSDFIQPRLTYIQTILNELYLLGYWKLNEVSGSNALDFQGMNNGTYNSCTLNQSGNNTLGPAVNINGGNIIIPDSQIFQTPYINGFPYPTSFTSPSGRVTKFIGAGLSIEVWILIPSSSSSEFIFLCKSDLSTKGFALAVKNHTLQFFTGTVWVDSTKIIDNNQWHHIIVTFSGEAVVNVSGGIGVVNFYIDGHSAGFRTSTYNLIDIGDDLVIGASSSDTLNITAKIMHVAIYGTPLSAIDVMNHYIAGTTYIPPTIVSTINTYSQLILSETSLISYWKLDESGGSTAYDSIDSNNGVYTDVNLYQTGNGFISRSVNFSNASDSNITVADNSNLNALTDLTLEVWVLIPASSDLQYVFICKKLALTGYAFRIYNHTFQFYAGNGTSWLDSGVVIDDANWHYIVGTIDNSGNIKTYVDGILATSAASYGQNLGNVGGSLTIGSGTTILSGDPVNNKFTGNMMQCAIYDSVLSGSDILSHYNTGISPQVALDESYILTGFSEMQSGLLG